MTATDLAPAAAPPAAPAPPAPPAPPRHVLLLGFASAFGVAASLALRATTVGDEIYIGIINLRLTPTALAA